MTQNEIIEGNKLIAEFMGLKMIEAKDITEDTNVNEHCFNPRYHSSWDWLIPCIGKISNQCDEPEELDGLKYALLCNDIDTAFNFIVDYINQ